VSCEEITVRPPEEAGLLSPTWSAVRDCKAEPAIALSPDAWIRGPSHRTSTQILTRVSAVVQERNAGTRGDSRTL
jgi:hypothetical protein